MRACLREPVDVCSQLRQMPTTERSTKPAQEHEHDGTGTSCVGEVELDPVLIGEREVGGELAD